MGTRPRQIGFLGLLLWDVLDLVTLLDIHLLRFLLSFVGLGFEL